MSLSISDVTLLAHASFGALGCIAAVWTFVETLHAKPGNGSRIQAAALATMLCMGAAWIFGGYFYVRFYPADKALILAGPWPLAHNFFMEVKEHLFFVTGILAIFLPIATQENLWASSTARKMVLLVAAMIAITGLAAEGAGAIINHGTRLSLNAQRAQK